MYHRLEQAVLLVTFTGFCWLAMQAVHEWGHVLGAYATGGTVVRVVLHPLTISRTDVHPNPDPLLVTWAGPAVGALLPLLAYLAAVALRAPGRFLFRFFAGFCLVANGAYIGVGSVEGIADAGELMRHGAAQWQLVLFGVAAISLGLTLWNGLGPAFGLGAARGRVSRPAVLISLALFVLLSAVLAVLGSP